jgi:Ca2+/Na+ antiporter
VVLILLNIIFCLSFIIFAWFNANDKDYWLWVPIYMIASIFCGLAAFDMYFPIGYLFMIAFYLIYALVLFFIKDGVLDWIRKYNTPSITESMQAKKPYIEKTREFFGLLIIAAALGLNYFVSEGI